MGFCWISWDFMGFGGISLYLKEFHSKVYWAFQGISKGFPVLKFKVIQDNSRDFSGYNVIEGS